MRLASLTVANFRGFTEQQTVPLDGDIVIVWRPMAQVRLPY